MEQYHVTGMSCAACSARVEKAVSALPGVTSCTVNLLTNSMKVDGTAESKAVIRAVKAAGYGAALKKDTAAAQPKNDDEPNLKHLKHRLITSVPLLLILMYFSMGHMLSLPIPTYFSENAASLGLLELLLSAMIMMINQKFFTNGFRSLAHRAPNMDTLVALGSSASFLWSVYVLFGLINAPSPTHHADFYFESAAMIVTLITVGKMLEARSKGKTTDALKGLLSLAPQTATLLRDGSEHQIPANELQVDDLFLVRPGESIPADGTILEGMSVVNESALTGESIPADKVPGDRVSAATINQSGALVCRAVRVGQDTTLSQIIQMVSDASAEKAPIAKTADRVSGIFVPAVLSVSLLTLIVWLLLGKEFSFALARAISVLVISCPCALGLATPVAVMVANGVGAKNGILFKTAVSLEETGKLKTIVLDKTGTITEGVPRVTDLLPSDGVTRETLLHLAYSLEQKSEHPLAGAIVAYGKDAGLVPEEVCEFSALPGNGLSAQLNGKELLGGSLRFLQTQTPLPAACTQAANRLSSEGKTPMLFLYDGQYIGMIAAADTIKSDSPQAIRELQKLGLRVIMLTGDNERTAHAIAKRAGVEEVIAEVLPDGKERVIRELQQQAPTAMVGDGINDAPALTRAEIGIAIGAGADIAIDAADLVLMKSTLADVPAAIRLSRAALRNIHENLFWAFIYNIIGIPLAAGCFVSLGLTLNPMFGAAAMSLSSFCVVSNALRLNRTRLYEKRKDEKK